MSRRQVLRSVVLLVRPGRTVLGLGLLLSGFALVDGVWLALSDPGQQPQAVALAILMAVALLGQAIALGSGGALDDQRATPWHMPPPTHQA
jgi:translation initiation factor 2 gamma subunit (eIF-2gamma)